MLWNAGGEFEGPQRKDPQQRIGPDPRAKYTGGARCLRCNWRELRIDPGKRSQLEIAHLDGNPAHTSEGNLAVLCKTCHRAHDYKIWAARCRETRAARKDRARPLLREIA